MCFIFVYWRQSEQFIYDIKGGYEKGNLLCNSQNIQEDFLKHFCRAHEDLLINTVNEGV